MASEQLPRDGLQHERTATGLVHPESIPATLLAQPQWVCWRYVDRGEGRKPDKQPVNPRNLANASVHWVNTWTSFDEAYATYCRQYKKNIHGIGFVLTPTDPYVAVDLDTCIHEKEIESAAAQIITQLESYTEISPSGQGIRILLACPDFQSNTRRGGIEVYSHSRYVTITGHHIAGTPTGITAVSAHLITSLVPPAPKPISAPYLDRAKPAQFTIDDSELWEHIFTDDKHGHQHFRRFQGDTTPDRSDHSLTVIRLLNCLARWTHGDAARMRNMMLLSPLANEKWFERRPGGDLLDYQIADAIAYVSRR